MVVDTSSAATRGARVGDVIAAISQLLEGKRYVHPLLGAQLAGNAPAPCALTSRELYAARILALGCTNGQVADEASVRVRAVVTHRVNLLRRLGLRTRFELVRCALDNRVIGPSANGSGE